MDRADVLIYDTTLRDGSQGEQVNFSAEEKLRIARRLDEILDGLGLAGLAE